MLALKCPKCRAGNMFEHNFLTNPRKFNKMHDYCPVCGENFYPEPGFYFGSAYFSYGFNVAILVTILVASFILYDPRVLELIVSILVPMLLLIPVNFRLSRALMLHLFGNISYDPEAAEKQAAGGRDQ